MQLLLYYLKFQNIFYWVTSFVSSFTCGIFPLENRSTKFSVKKYSSLPTLAKITACPSCLQCDLLAMLSWELWELLDLGDPSAHGQMKAFLDKCCHNFPVNFYRVEYLKIDNFIMLNNSQIKSSFCDNTDSKSSNNIC